MSISASSIEVPTRWGNIPARYPYLRHVQPATTVAVLFPGRTYPLDAPVMWYAAKAALNAGCDALGVEYGYQSNRCRLDMNEMDMLVKETVEAIERVVSTQYSKVVFIGKSLGTVIMTEVKNALKFRVSNQVFLTPLQETASQICSSENALVIVGDNDSLFGRAEISQITGLSNVLLNVIPGADHGLEFTDPVDSVQALKLVTQLCGEFCRQLKE